MIQLKIQATIDRLYAKHGKTLFRIGAVALVFFGTVITLYALWGKGNALHYDEWVGRGLYPAIAMGYGADLYEPKSGPHVTLYGPGLALFYVPTALASEPSEAIWFAFILNIVGFFAPVFYLFNRLLSGSFPNHRARFMAAAGSTLLVLVIFAIEPTTEGILRIHADLPAFFFLMMGICLFDAYLAQKSRIWLYLAALSLALSVWTKLPTLTASGVPFLFLCLERRFREALLFFLLLIGAGALTTAFFTLLYGWEDTVFVLFKHISANSWSIRDKLFNGTKATLSKMSYFEAIPLMFRFFVMYLAEYWYIALSCLATFVIAFRLKGSDRFLFLCIPLAYALTLPPGLAALAHFGSVENSLLFANATGLLALFLGIVRIIAAQLNPRPFLICLWIGVVLFSLPFVRLSRGGPKTTDDNPQSQAFAYLQDGNKDVYFGWYPLAHLFHSGEVLTSIEAPTWVGMTLPDEIDFSIRHFPPRAKYLALGPTGYGSQVLKRYLGELREVPAPPELSTWRLYEPIERKNW
jgi:hypothetical protein